MVDLSIVMLYSLPEGMAKVMAINGKITMDDSSKIMAKVLVSFHRMESGFKMHYETDDSAIGPRGTKDVWENPGKSKQK